MHSESHHIITISSSSSIHTVPPLLGLVVSVSLHSGRADASDVSEHCDQLIVPHSLIQLAHEHRGVGIGPLVLLVGSAVEATLGRNVSVMYSVYGIRIMV